MTQPTDYWPPSPSPRPRGTASANMNDVPDSPTPKFEAPKMSVKEQALAWSDRQISSTRDMLASYQREIDRLEELLDEYRDGANILRKLIGEPVDTNDTAPA